MHSILFVCTANQFRSPIAEVCFSKKLATMEWGNEWIVQSAGTWASPGRPALPSAIAAARKIGLSLEEHEAQLVTHELIPTQDLILVMEKEHKEMLQNEFSIFSKHIFLLSEVVQGKVEDIADPVLSKEDNYFKTATKINALVTDGFYRICGKALEVGAYRRIAV